MTRILSENRLTCRGQTPRPYPAYHFKSGWNSLLPKRQPNPPLEGKHSADVVIIGAGFTGLASARRWCELEPNQRIVVIDASEIGEGNSGRNSGFLLEIALAEDADPANRARMEECNRLTRHAMASIVQDVKAADEPVDLQRAGTFRAAASELGLRALRNYRTFLEAAHLPFRMLGRKEMESELGTAFYQQGLYSPDCYLGQPAAVIRAIAKQLPGSIGIYENTPALKLTRSGLTWCVNTPKGSITSKQIILANNSYSKNLGVARSKLAAVYTYAGLTPVLDKSVLASLGSNHNWGLLPCHRLGSTLRRTVDGRLLLRSLHDYERERDAQAIRGALLDRLWRRFPQLKGTEFEHAWGGAVGFTRNGAPIWGEPEPGLLVSSGCNGGGTVKGTLFGRLLVDFALGNPAPNINSLFGSATWMPPDPIRGLGFKLTSKLQSWQARHEL